METLVFTRTTVHYTYAYASGKIHSELTGTYTYVPPKVTIKITSPESIEGLINTGIIEKDIIDGIDQESLNIRNAISWRRCVLGFF